MLQLRADADAGVPSVTQCPSEAEATAARKLLYFSHRSVGPVLTTACDDHPSNPDAHAPKGRKSHVCLCPQVVLLFFAAVLLFSSFKLLSAGDEDDDDADDLSQNFIVKTCKCAHIFFGSTQHLWSDSHCLHVPFWNAPAWSWGMSCRCPSRQHSLQLSPDVVFL